LKPEGFGSAAASGSVGKPEIYTPHSCVYKKLRNWLRVAELLLWQYNIGSISGNAGKHKKE
jgi:hypothetical protein